MTKLSQEKISELNLVGRINNRMLNGMGINLVKGEFELLPSTSKDHPISTVEQFDYLRSLLRKVLSGVNPSDNLIESARLYLFDRDAYQNELPHGSIIKYHGKRLAVKRLVPTHHALSNWPSSTMSKIEVMAQVMGGREVNRKVQAATVDCIDNGVGINESSSSKGVTYTQVKNMINKVEQFDLAVKEYGDL